MPCSEKIIEILKNYTRLNDIRAKYDPKFENVNFNNVINVMIDNLTYFSDLNVKFSYGTKTVDNNTVIEGLRLFKQYIEGGCDKHIREFIKTPNIYYDFYTFTSLGFLQNVLDHYGILTDKIEAAILKHQQYAPVFITPFLTNCGTPGFPGIPVSLRQAQV